MTSHIQLNQWIKDMADLCNPDDIHLCDGSQAEYQQLLDLMVLKQSAVLLNPDKRPKSYAFFSDPTDVARIEERTFIASKDPKDAGPTNNWMESEHLKSLMKTLYKGSMVGRTMYVMPFVMGPLNSIYSRLGVQITDSPYVVVHMHHMTRMGEKALARLGDDQPFVKCLHSVGYPLKEGIKDVAWPCAPFEKRYISHFPEERMIWSYGSGYGGNALLGKKCFALRIASKMAHDEGWLAEHMLILKITNPEHQSKYFAAAFPSACGKTNLAMMVPKLEGWKVETIGDDIAWMHISPTDGKLYAINPEHGFFGVARGTSMKTNPAAVKMIEKNTLFTNVALTDDLDVYWRDADIKCPYHLKDWEQQDWFKGSLKEPNHPNARYTVPITESPVVAPEWQDPEGVPISGIIFGGRRQSTIPLVHQSLHWNHGVFLGSIIGSEITSAIQSTHLGQVRRDPFAMLPFIGYHISDYFKHWFDIRKKTTKDKLPLIFYVNWFKKDDNNRFLWPGFGENIRVLKWMFERIDQTADARLTDIGYIPTKEALDLEGLNLSDQAIKSLLSVDKKAWLLEVDAIERFYHTLSDQLPIKLMIELNQLKERLMQDDYHEYIIDEFSKEEDDTHEPYVHNIERN